MNAQKTIFEQVIEAGIPFNNHCSDLYIPVTTDTAKLLRKCAKENNYTSMITQFTSNIDGKLWYDIPFAYDPYWAKCDEMTGTSFFLGE